MGRAPEDDEAFRARAAARASRITFARLTTLDDDPPMHEDDTPEQRLTAMWRLCRSVWRFAGRELPPPLPRAELPGEVFELPHGRSRAAR